MKDEDRPGTEEDLKGYATKVLCRARWNRSDARVIRAPLAALLLLAAGAACALEVGSALGGNCTNQKLSELCGGSPLGSPEFSACATTRLAEASVACQTTRPGVVDPQKRIFDPMNPCEEDRLRLCPAKPKGSRDASVCLAWFRKQVSPACAVTLRPEDKQEPEIVQPKPPAHFHQEVVFGRCSDEEIRTYCPDKTGPALNDCLVRHEADVSKRCRILIADLKLKRRAAAACKADIAKSCADTKDFDDALLCLGRAGGDVSAACKTALLPRDDD